MLRSPRKEDRVDCDLIARLEGYVVGDVQSQGNVILFVSDKKAVVLLSSADDKLGIVDKKRNV